MEAKLQKLNFSKKKNVRMNKNYGKNESILCIMLTIFWKKQRLPLAAAVKIIWQML